MTPWRETLHALFYFRAAASFRSLLLQNLGGAPRPQP
jgi:hypothetical protein